MSLPWFRMYHEFAGDPVIQCLAFEDQRHFVMVLCLKASGFLDREWPNDEIRHRMICHALGLDPASGAEAKRRLMEVAVVGQDWQPANWDKRQFQSDNSSGRVRNWRAKQRETLPKRCSNAQVTPQDTDTDTDTDSEKKIPTVSVEPKLDDPVFRVFQHWQSAHDHPQAKLDEKRRKVIRRALKTYPEEALRSCIEGYKLSPHHQGKNATGTVYDSIELMLRDAQHIDAGIKLANGSGGNRWI